MPATTDRSNRSDPSDGAPAPAATTDRSNRSDPSDDAPAAPAATAEGRPPGDPRAQDIVRRLRSVEGHVRGVERMVQEDAYCIDVMNQIQAVQKALERISGLVLDRHLHSCVTHALRGDDPEERERVIGEVLEVFRASGRR